MTQNKDYEYLEYRAENRVHVVQFGNPPVNLLTSEIQDELRTAVRRFEDDVESLVLLFRGEPGGVFSGGRNLNESKSWIESDDIEREVETAWRRGRRLLDEIANASKVTIAVVEGAAVGGGAELLLPFDFIFASESAEIGFPEIKRGLFPGTGALELLEESIGHRKTLEALLTGDLESASDWSDVGLVTHSCEPGTTYERARKFADAISRRPRPAVIAIKKVSHAYRKRDTEDARHFELARFQN
ncbi:MAG: enoyl-CoA hydratase/isomerase family protein, partial [Natronomonas sp.]|uniref:enoyl-CoA hydratase/isomerase family protein n=1 Tax=Natronomonas sp. TaxID=2184060 RepID=UPI00286FB6EB